MSNPFANGTEERAWQSVWCDECHHDHDEMHVTQNGPGCETWLLGYLLPVGEPGEFVWPECWPKVPDFWKSLPATFACLKFQRCACPPEAHSVQKARLRMETRTEVERVMRESV